MCRVCDKGGGDSSHVESPELHKAISYSPRNSVFTCTGVSVSFSLGFQFIKSTNQLQPKRLSFHLRKCLLSKCFLTDWKRKPDTDSVLTCTSVFFRQLFFNKLVSIPLKMIKIRSIVKKYATIFILTCPLPNQHQRPTL